MIYRLEKKFGKYAIPNLMRYITAMYVIGWVISMVSPQFYMDWLALDLTKVAKGQVWRFVTFLIQPIDGTSDNPYDMVFMLISIYLYYFIGTMLERLWGSFRFNLFYISGIFFNILAVVIIYVGTYLYYGAAYSYGISLNYINLSMFLAFAVEFADVSLLLFFVIPVKVKYIGIFMAAFNILNIASLILSGRALGVYMGVALIVAMLNFIIFFISSKNYKKSGVGNYKRRFAYAAAVRRGEKEAQVVGTAQSGRTTVSRHRCVVCGRTELDSPDLEFRFCSKCEGNYEYCMDHLYTHVHVVREPRQTDAGKEDKE